MSHPVRRADASDPAVVGRMLHDFNREFDEPTPSPEAMAERVAELFESGDITVLLAGEGPEGLALMRFRPSLRSRTLDCYLEELYVVPDRRGEGLGRALMESVLATAREEGAAYIDLGTAETDTAARGLYESFGFSNSEGKPDGPVNYFYEREL